MKRLVLMLMLILALAACGPSGVPSSPEAPANVTVPSEPIKTVVDADESTEAEFEPSDAATDSGSEPAVPVLTAAQVSVVRSQDHVLGAAVPAVTIIEYGDFQ